MPRKPPPLLQSIPFSHLITPTTYMLPILVALEFEEKFRNWSEIDIWKKILDNVQQSTPNVVNFLKYSVFLTLKIIQFKFTLKTKCKKFVTRETCHRGGGSKFHAGEMEQTWLLGFLLVLLEAYTTGNSWDWVVERNVRVFIFVIRLRLFLENIKRIERNLIINESVCIYFHY